MQNYWNFNQNNSNFNQNKSNFKQNNSNFKLNNSNYEQQNNPLLQDEDIIDNDDANNPEEEEDVKLAKKKHHPYVSKLLARSFRNEPLSNLEYFKANFDMALFPPQDPSKVITSFNDVPDDVKEDACKTLDLMRTMPNRIESYQAQLDWDLVMLKCQVTSFAFGIPGESQCHECCDDEKSFNFIQDRFSHHFEVHSVNSFACLTCDKYFNANEALVKHLKKRHKFVEKIVTIQSGGQAYVTNSGDTIWLIMAIFGFKSAY